MASVQSIHEEFIRLYTERCSMVSDGTVLLQASVSHDGSDFTPQMYNTIVESCFMQIYLAWENFLEKSFVAYLQNATDLKGQTYSRYGFPTDDNHSYNMLKGTKSYPDWTNIDDVNYLAKTYFDASGPYAIISSPHTDFLDMKIVRNRISHISEKSTKSFNRVLAKNIAQTNLSPGEYLMLFKDSSVAQTYFTYYVDMLKDCVDAICNS